MLLIFGLCIFMILNFLYILLIFSSLYQMPIISIFDIIGSSVPKMPLKLFPYFSMRFDELEYFQILIFFPRFSRVRLHILFVVMPNLLRSFAWIILLVTFDELTQFFPFFPNKIYELIQPFLLLMRPNFSYLLGWRNLAFLLFYFLCV